ncbi:MAG: cytochrome c maturation protein CcmE [Bacteroidia bacterium]|nr:cytochrome c maturation protein CcmE [Bacteroidia bacterium]
MKPVHIVVLVVMAVFIVALGLNFAGTASIYTDFETARQTGREVHIVGTWVNREQAVYDDTRDLFSFYLQDTLSRMELVKYYDPMPENFHQAEKIVVIGGYKKGEFVADKIIMKCPSKYEPETITGN